METNIENNLTNFAIRHNFNAEQAMYLPAVLETCSRMVGRSHTWFSTEMLLNKPLAEYIVETINKIILGHQ